MPYLPKARAENIVIQNLEKETLIYDLKINKAFCLNETSSLVWQFCNGKISVVEISGLMSKKLKTLISEDFVWLAVHELRKNNLLDNEAELKNHFANISRREMARRVGLASMVVLPMITSVVAPSATQAQSSSCAQHNQPCLYGNHTQGNCCDPMDRCQGGGVIGQTFCESCISNYPYAFCFSDATSCQTICENDPWRNSCCNFSPVTLAPNPLSAGDFLCVCGG